MLRLMEYHDYVCQIAGRLQQNNMTTIFPSLYQLKKIFFWPRTFFMRWKYRKNSGPAKVMMELHYYRRPFMEFMGATIYNAHILHEAAIGSQSVVLDVGAFNGSWAQHIIDRYDPVIYAFEPNPRSYAQVQAKAEGNPKLRPISYGLGDKDMAAEFTLKGLGSSMYDERDSSSDAPRTTVEIAAIDRVWSELKLENVGLMKINIEGAEFPLLEKMIECDLLKCVDCFLIQFHEWHPGAYKKRRRIRNELAKTHRLEWDYYFVWEKWVRL